MKGQHIIINEILIFAIGLAITSFVVMNFNILQETLKEKALRSQLSSVANSIASAIALAGATNSTNTTLSLAIPEKVSEESYLISVQDAGGRECERSEDCRLNLKTSVTSFSMQIFNISQSYNIKGSIHSSAKYIQVKSDGKNIELLRA